MKILTVKIKVEDNIEAYAIVSGLGFEHSVIEADLDGYSERFHGNNKAAYFLRDNKKNNLRMLDKADIKEKVKIKKQ
jgi:hypothetical protein